MKEDKDRLMEGLWMLYQAEGAPRNISIEQFCMNNNVNYHEFYKWYKSLHHGVYQLHIDGTPDNINATTLAAVPSKEYEINPHAKSTHEVYTSGGKQVLMSEEAYELFKHQLDINTKMYQRIHDMEFNDKMKRKTISLLFHKRVWLKNISVVYHTFVESCKLASISVKDYFVKFFESIVSGRTDYENLLPTTIGLKQ